MWTLDPSLTKEVSPSPMAVVRFSRLRSAWSRAFARKVELWSHLGHGPRAPTGTVAHLAALVVSREFFAAMRSTLRTQVLVSHFRGDAAHAVLSSMLARSARRRREGPHSAPPGVL